MWIATFEAPKLDATCCINLSMLAFGHQHASLSAFWSPKMQVIMASASQKCSYRPLISYSLLLFSKLPPPACAGHYLVYSNITVYKKQKVDDEKM